MDKTAKLTIIKTLIDRLEELAPDVEGDIDPADTDLIAMARKVFFPRRKGKGGR